MIAADRLLERLAGVWVGRWLKYGGGLIIDGDCDKIQISMALDGRRWRSRHPTAHQRQWHDGWTVGRWRELQELAREVPGLREAIIDQVMAHGKQSACGSVHMVAPHPWAEVEAA